MTMRFGCIIIFLIVGLLLLSKTFSVSPSKRMRTEQSLVLYYLTQSVNSSFTDLCQKWSNALLVSVYVVGDWLDLCFLSDIV